MTGVQTCALPISDTTPRDFTQSNSGNRFRLAEDRLIGPYLDNVGYFSIENGGGAHFHVAMMANMAPSQLFFLLRLYENPPLVSIKLLLKPLSSADLNVSFIPCLCCRISLLSEKSAVFSSLKIS